VDKSIVRLVDPKFCTVKICRFVELGTATTVVPFGVMLSDEMATAIVAVTSSAVTVSVAVPSLPPVQDSVNCLD